MRLRAENSKAAILKIVSNGPPESNQNDAKMPTIQQITVNTALSIIDKLPEGSDATLGLGHGLTRRH